MWVKKTVSLHILFVAIYVLANLFAIVSTFLTGELGGDFTGFIVTSRLTTVLLGLSLIIAFIFVMFPVNSWFETRTLLRRLNSDDVRPNFIISVVIFLLQAIYIIYSITYDAGIAGMTSKNESPLKYIFYVISTDFLFLFYLSSSSIKDKFVIFNTIFFIASNIIRGWASVYMVIAWILLVKMAINGHLNKRRISVFIIVGILVIPIASFLKYYFRLKEANAVDLLSAFNFASLTWSDILDIYNTAIIGLTERLQQFSSLAVIWDKQAILNASVESGFTKLFLLDGFFGFFLLRILGIPESYDLGSSIISILLGFDPLTSSYATHVGIFGWLIVTPEYFLVYILYLATLMYLSIKLVKYCQSKGVRELNWLAWLLFLMHGWFGVFISYLLSGFIYGYLKRRLNPRLTKTVTTQHGID